MCFSNLKPNQQLKYTHAVLQKDEHIWHLAMENMIQSLLTLLPYNYLLKTFEQLG